VAQGFFFSPNANTGHKPNAVVISGPRFIDSLFDAFELAIDEDEPGYTGTQAGGDERLTDEQLADAKIVLNKMRENGDHLSNGQGVWHRVAQALCRYAGGEQLFIDFSRGDPKFSEKDCIAKLRQKRRGHATSIAHLFAIAGECGIDNPAIHQHSSAVEDFAEELAEPTPEELKLEAIEYTLDGFLSAGVTYIAGGHGIGKSSLLVPLACMVSGEVKGLDAVLTRKVIYITEDPQQARRIRYGLKKHNGLVENNHFRIMQARRMTPDEIERIVATAVEKHTISGPNGYPVKPLMVFDTTNACFEIENENDAALVGRVMSALKQAGSSVWIVGHLAKAIARDDIAAMTGRGSGAWEADAQCTAFIFADDEDTDVRYMQTKKRRFEAGFIEIKYITKTDHEYVLAPWGEEQKIGFRYGLPERCRPGERQDAAADRREAEQEQQLNADCNLIVAYLQTQKEPVSRQTLERDGGVPRNRTRLALLRLVDKGVVDNKVQYVVPPQQPRADGIMLVVAEF